MRHREVIIGCVATLMLTGLVMVYSNTAVSCGLTLAENKFLHRQIVWILASAAAMAIFAFIDYHAIARHSRSFVVIVLLALAALLFLASPVNGARRWFRIGSVSIQVSEFAKIAAILWLADFASRKREVLGNFWRGVVPPLVVIAAFFGLILVEPDFGTAVLIAGVGLTILVVAGVRWRHVVALVATSVPLLFVFLRMEEYRWRRLLVFLNPWADPRGAGYHVCQSLIALGAGGLAGVGPGRSLQKLGFLPEAETDFIFAVIGQETGLIGCLLLVTVFVALFWAGMAIARAAPDVLGSLIAVGVSVLIGFQMLINVGVATSSMPTKGISLPFVSLGGSALLGMSIGIGILLNVSRHCPRVPVPTVRGATRRGDWE